ncbi:PilI type IV pilus biogenesis protein [Salmonella enterica]
MPQQHPGRLQVLVVDTHCKRKLFSTKTQTDPDELARRFCTPDNCLVVVLCNNRFLFRLERAPGSHCRWRKGSCVFRSIRSRIGIEVRSAIRIHSINRELNFFYRFLTRFFAAFHYRGIFPQ